MGAQDYRSRSYATWEAMAPGWERDREDLWEASRTVGEWMVERLDPRPGQILLELAAGPGDTGFLAARRLGGEGRLICSDFSPAMVEVARRRGTELGLTNVEYRVLDAENCGLASGSVDGVLCRWGYMLMADPLAALRETRRVLRNGGRLVLSVWGAPERNPWALVGRLLVERGHAPPPTEGVPGLFSMAGRDRVLALVADAGFESAEVEEVEVSWTFPRFQDYWSFMMELAGAVSMTLAALSEDERDSVRAEAEREAERYRTGVGFRLPGLCLNAVAS